MVTPDRSAIFSANLLELVATVAAAVEAIVASSMYISVSYCLVTFSRPGTSDTSMPLSLATKPISSWSKLLPFCLKVLEKFLLPVSAEIARSACGAGRY